MNHFNLYENLDENQSGAALIELAISLLLMLTVLFSLVEFSRYLQIANLGTTVSKELGNTVSRECLFTIPTNLPGQENRRNDCINKVLDQFDGILKARGIQAAVNIIQITKGDTPGSRAFAVIGSKIVADPPKPDTPSFEPRFEVIDGELIYAGQAAGSGQFDTELLAPEGFTVISEVTVNFDPSMMPLVDFILDDFYCSTII